MPRAFAIRCPHPRGHRGLSANREVSPSALKGRPQLREAAAREPQDSRERKFQGLLHETDRRAAMRMLAEVAMRIGRNGMRSNLDALSSSTGFCSAYQIGCLLPGSKRRGALAEAERCSRRTAQSVLQQSRGRDEKVGGTNARAGCTRIPEGIPTNARCGAVRSRAQDEGRRTRKNRGIPQLHAPVPHSARVLEHANLKTFRFTDSTAAMREGVEDRRSAMKPRACTRLGKAQEDGKRNAASSSTMRRPTRAPRAQPYQADLIRRASSE